jgi:multiple sugar transport system permease protein
MTVANPTTRRLSTAQRETMWGLIFLSPWIIGFLAFTLIPMGTSLLFSFTQFNLIKPEEGMQFIGFRNYLRLFNDPQLLNAMGVTLRFALISVPLGIAFPLAVAVLVNSKHLIGKDIFRTLFYMPYMIPAVVGVMVWGGILNSNSGWLNNFLQWILQGAGKQLTQIGLQASLPFVDWLVNFKGPSWFQDEAWVLPAFSIMSLWGIGNTMMTLLAGLQNVPTELYESATVDGATPVNKFFAITLPMISPIIFYNLVLATIGAFQQFTAAFIIGNGRGDPNGATFFYNLYLYKTAFAFLDMGYGSTLAWAMFVVALILTIVMFATANRWVYYAYSGEE